MVGKRALMLVLASLLAPRAHSNLPSAISRAEARYFAARSMQASFLERYLEGGHLVRIESGVAYFRKPGRMRWNYESPEKSEFVVDGITAWFYVPLDRTVTRVPAKKSEDWRTPLSLLAGEMKFSRICSQLRPAPSQHVITPGDEVFVCMLRGVRGANPGQGSGDTGSEGSVLIEISPSSCELARILINDPGGTSIDFQFQNWQFNPVLPDSLFHFQPPPGVAIVNGELPVPDSGVNH